MQKILIVEDDKIQMEKLLCCIHSHYPLWKIIAADSYTAAHTRITDSVEQQQPFTLFLLDVQLTNDKQDLSGFTLAETIRAQKLYYQVPILFLTSITDKTQFALSNFHCYNYITKPYLSEDIVTQIQQMLLTGHLKNNTIHITDKNHIQHRITIEDIYWIEKKSHAQILVTKTGKVVTSNLTFEDLLSLLNEDFIQCHKKFIINANYIMSYDKTNRYVCVHNQTIPVSRTYKAGLERLLVSETMIN